MWLRDGQEIIIGFRDPKGNPVQISGTVKSQMKWGFKVPLIVEVQEPQLTMEIKSGTDTA